MKITTDEHNAIVYAIDYISAGLDGADEDKAEALQVELTNLSSLRLKCKALLDKQDEQKVKRLAKKMANKI